MKGFISYRFTGEKLEDLHALLGPVRDALQDKGVDAYCNLHDEDLANRSKNFKPQDYVFDAFKTIDGVDVLFVVVTSENKSEGMILEMGYALGKNKSIIVAVKEGVGRTYLPGMAKVLIKWTDINDLVSKIKQLDFENLK